MSQPNPSETPAAPTIETVTETPVTRSRLAWLREFREVFVAEWSAPD